MLRQHLKQLSQNIVLSGMSLLFVSPKEVPTRSTKNSIKKTDPYKEYSPWPPPVSSINLPLHIFCQNLSKYNLIIFKKTTKMACKVFLHAILLILFKNYSLPFLSVKKLGMLILFLPKSLTSLVSDAAAVSRNSLIGV